MIVRLDENLPATSIRTSSSESHVQARARVEYNHIVSADTTKKACSESWRLRKRIPLVLAITTSKLLAFQTVKDVEDSVGFNTRRGKPA